MIKLKRGLDLPVAGQPAQAVSEGTAVRSVALLGADYLGMQPTMKVAEGDRVVQGQVLFTDKKNPAVAFTAPATGRVRAIHRGARRVFQSLVIDVEQGSTEAQAFPAHAALATLTAAQVQEQLLASGLWTALRSRPFGRVPVPGSQPASLFVTAMDSNPLAADPAVVIAARQQDFNDGLTVLARLVPKVFVCKAAGAAFQTGSLPAQEFSGPHPAGLVGTHIHFLDPVSAGKSVWHLNYQDVIAIGVLFREGRLDVSRVVALAGPQVKNPRLVRTRLGASLDDLVAGELAAGENRVVSGSLLAGRTATGVAAWLGRYHLQVSVLAEGREREFVHYLRPGLDRHSVFSIYLGKWVRKIFPFTTSTNGSPRAMVPVGTYEAVMPLDILPTQLLRYILVGDTDMAQQLGVLELDEEDLGLCTYVCPGKYEYGPILRDVLTRIELEG
ncbi:MAG TPA: Na(+)-translocating NADH-quinone reductase subunit A [Moraxellaceae bacterium]|nr:Na(+)-translocating NADH-quinone reductase subunit A [Moraxellaceae bacterium]